MREFEIKTYIRAIMNGGDGSGNHNPGQGRGVGKPNSRISYSEKMTQEECNKNIETFMSMFNKKRLINKQEMEKALAYDLEEGRSDTKDKTKIIEDIANGKRWAHYGTNDDKFNGGNRYCDDIAFWAEKACPVLYGISRYTQGAKWYGKEAGGRKRFDERYGISNFIDNNADVHFSSNEPLYRGVSSNKKRLKELKVGSEIDFNGCSSWTTSKEVSKHFLNASLVQRGKEKVIFVEKTGGKRNAIANPLSSLNEGIAGSYGGPQNEVIYSGNTKFEIIGIENKDGATYVEVREK